MIFCSHEAEKGGDLNVMVLMDEDHQGEDMIRAKVFAQTARNRRTVNNGGLENGQKWILTIFTYVLLRFEPKIPFFHLLGPPEALW